MSFALNTALLSLQSLSLRRTSFASEYDDARQQKEDVARVLKVARQEELKANADSARVREAASRQRQRSERPNMCAC